MNKPYQSRFQYIHMSIRHKLLTITLLGALLIITIALIGFQLVIRNYNQMVYTQTASSLGAIGDKVAARLDNLMEVSLHIAVNREFQTHLETMNSQPLTSAEGSARLDISRILYSTFHSDLISITVLPLTHNHIVVGAVSSQETPQILDRAQQLANEAMGAPVWLSTGRNDASVLCARQIRNVTRPFLEPMGLLLLRVNLGKIVNESAGDILSGQYDIAIRQDGELLYPHADVGTAQFDDSAFAGGELFAIGRQHGTMRFITSSVIRAFRLQWHLLLAIPYEDIFRSLIITNIAFVLGLLAALVLALLFSRRMFDDINMNIQLLTSKMNRVQQGNLQPYPAPAPPGADELSLLNRHFDKMTADFKQVIDDNYIKELLLTQTQLKALEQQINPHFLYNSLDSINWFARRGDGKHVSAIAQSLGGLLRHTLSEDEDCIPIRRELSILDHYLRIQRIRFPDTLHVDMQVDDSMLDVPVPKMSIQPLVENAIIHSMEENIGDCHIDIRIVPDGELVKIEVENDGSEIDTDILNKLKDKSVQPRGHGIGLINIDSRIKLLFGQDYGLTLQNVDDGVIVSFRIPAKSLQPKEDIRC